MQTFKYHVLYSGVVIASFQHPLHREIFLTAIRERFPYADESVTTQDELIKE